MRLKAMLGVCALLLVSACASDVTAPSTSRTSDRYRADTGLPTMGSGGYTGGPSGLPTMGSGGYTSGATGLPTMGSGGYTDSVSVAPPN